MATNTNTHYLMAKAQHKATLRRTRRRYDQLVVQANMALEEAALNFMRAQPKVDRCVIGMGTVTFWKGDDPISPDWGPAPKWLVTKVEAFDRDFVEPFTQMFGPTFRPFRAIRNGKGIITTERKW